MQTGMQLTFPEPARDQIEKTSVVLMCLCLFPNPASCHLSSVSAAL